MYLMKLRSPEDQFETLKKEREVEIWERLQSTIEQKVKDKNNEHPNLDEKYLEFMAPEENIVKVKTGGNGSEKRTAEDGEDTSNSNSETSSNSSPQNFLKQKSQI